MLLIAHCSPCGHGGGVRRQNRLQALVDGTAGTHARNEGEIAQDLGAITAPLQGVLQPFVVQQLSQTLPRHFTLSQSKLLSPKSLLQIIHMTHQLN